MIRLILTNLKYLTFEKLFLVGAVGELFLGIRGGIICEDYGWTFEYPVFSVLIIAAVTLMNCGRENTDGTLRNKLTLGYTRQGIFGSFLISSLICSLVLYLLFSLPLFLISKDTIGQNMTGERLLMFWAIILCIVVLITVGSVCLTLCIPMLPVAAVALLAAAIGFVAVAGLVSRALEQPKYISYGTYSDDPSVFTDTDKYEVFYDEVAGQYCQYGEQLNENYVDGTKRKIYQTLFLLSPYGQLYNVNEMMQWYEETDVLAQYEELKRTKPEIFENDGDNGILGAHQTVQGYENLLDLPYYPIYSLSFAAVLAAAGLLVFRKRNIN